MTLTTITKVDAEQRADWLTEFHDAGWNVRRTLSSLEYTIDALRVAGNDSLADRLSSYTAQLREDYETMDAAVSRMISEYAKESLDSIGETFRALLQATGDAAKGIEQ